MKIVNMNDLNEHNRTQAAQMLTDQLPKGWATLEDAIEEVNMLLDNDDEPDALFLAAIENDEVIGWCGILPEYDGRVYELHPLVVRHDQQGKGVGRLLMAAIEEAARNKGGLTIYLGADDEANGGETSLANVDLYDNLPKRIQEFEPGTHQTAFYLKLGYKVVGVVPDAGGKGKPDIMMAKALLAQHKNTHAHKAESYDIGRPYYPVEFYDYLNSLCNAATIADIGAGTGKITKGFLERGSHVYALEPDKDMLQVLYNNLASFPGCIPIEGTGENTGIPDNTVGLIFCGNSYHWLDKGLAIPEFKRILQDTSHEINIAICSLGPGRANSESPFKAGKYIEKTFEYIVQNRFHEYLHGHLSASNAPVPGDEGFVEYCATLKQKFDKQSTSGKVATKFILRCMLGNVDNLK